MKNQIQAILADVTIPIDERIARVDRIYTDVMQSAANSNHNEDGNYANLLSEYAQFLYAYARYSDAEQKYLYLITIAEKLYGKNHPETATAYNNIGLVYDKLCDFDKALEYYKKALQICEANSGYNNPDIAMSFDNIGKIYCEQGEYKKALKFIIKALEIRESILGTNHPDTANSYDNTGELYFEQGEYKKALEFFNKALDIRESTLGTNHPGTATAYNNIGGVYYKRGEYKKALDFFNKALGIQESILGTNHPDTATAYNNIGKVYYEQGEYKKALTFFNKALGIRESILGTNHPDTANSLNSIGLFYDEEGNYDKALEYYKKALNIRERVFGYNHPDSAKSYNNIGTVYYSKDDYDKALEYLLKALGIITQIIGKDHPDTASTYNNIGLIYYSQGNYDKAISYYNKALEIRKNVLGEDHSDTASSFYNLGLLYRELGDYDKALKYLNHALYIREKVLGKDHIDTANAYNSIGTIHSLQNDDELALNNYKKALLIFKDKLGENDPQTAVVYSSIGEVYSKKGKNEKALEYYSKSIPIIEKKLGVENTIDTSNQDIIDVQDPKEQLQQSSSLDKTTFSIINDITKCTAALSDVYIDFQKELQTLADDLRQTFNSEYCAIGIVDGNLAEDCIVSLEPHKENSLQKLQTELLESVRFVEISNKNILLCRALDLKSHNIVYFSQEDIRLSETYGKFQDIMRSGSVFSNIVIPLRDKYKQNIGYLQFLNSEEKIDFNKISPLITAFLGLAKTILQKNIKLRNENRERDFDFYDKIQKAKGANQLLDEIMEYLATEFNAAIVSFRIPIANAPKKNLSHFYLRRCYVNSKIINRNRIISHYRKERILIPKDEMGGYEDLRIVHKEQVIYHNVKNTSLNHMFDLDLYDKFITLPVFRDDTTNKPLIKQLYGTFQLRLFNPTISKNNIELVSRIRFQRELVEAKKRLTFLSEQITLLFNSYVHRFENESLQIFQNELKNSSFVKIQDFDERCANIINNSVHANICSIYRFDKATEQLMLSATTAQTIHFNNTNKNLHANNNKERFSIPVTSKKNVLVRAFTAKKPTYIFDIRDTDVHQSSFIEFIDKKSGNDFLSAMVVPILKKNGECSGVVLLLGKVGSNRFISTAYWEHDISHIEFIVNTLTRISESDNERMTFLSQLSHELLTPIAEMVYDNDYIIHLAKDNPNGTSKQELISKLEENINTCMLLKYVITDTEFRYAFNGRKMDYNITRQNRPQEVIMDTIHLLEKESLDKCLTIRTDISKMPPMYFDKEHMMQVLINLLKNAIRYSDKSTTIFINYQFQNDQHEIIFANYGIGVLEEEKDAIFELFYRGQKTKGKFVRGTGIGLYIVRDIMRNHGGDCFVRNLNNPTEFVITLPNK